MHNKNNKNKIPFRKNLNDNSYKGNNTAQQRIKNNKGRPPNIQTNILFH